MPKQDFAVPVAPLPAQRRVVEGLLRRSDAAARWDCASSDTGADWLRQLTYERVPVARGRLVFLVQAGPGCMRGGQGANGAMWLVQVRHGRATLLAGEGGHFDGWLYGPADVSHHEFRDLVIAWHLSAVQARLTYLVFDGRRYVATARTIAFFDPDGRASFSADF